MNNQNGIRNLNTLSWQFSFSVFLFRVSRQNFDLAQIWPRNSKFQTNGGSKIKLAWRIKQTTKMVFFWSLVSNIASGYWPAFSLAPNIQISNPHWVKIEIIKSVFWGGGSAILTLTLYSWSDYDIAFRNQAMYRNRGFPGLVCQIQFLFSDGWNELSLKNRAK